MAARKFLAVFLSAAVLLFSRVAGGFQADVHYDTTFAIALATGWSWQDAKLIASTNIAVDENFDTRPSILISEGSPYDAPQSFNSDSIRHVIPQSLGRLAAFANYPAALALQDFYFHCFSRNKDNRKKRNPDVLTRLGALEADVIQKLDTARARPSPGGRNKALIAIGVYLHCQQDSWSHSGYGGEPLGHVKDGSRPDNPANDRDVTVNALTETINKLNLFRERLDRIKPLALSAVARDELFESLSAEGALRMSDVDRRTCYRDLVQFWSYRTLAQQNRLTDARTVPDAPKNISDRQIGARTIAVARPGGYRVDPESGQVVPQIELPSDRFGKEKEIPQLPTPARPAPLVVAFLVNTLCDSILQSTYARVPEVNAIIGKCLFTFQPCPTLRFRTIRLPAVDYPVLKTEILIRDPVENDAGDFQKLSK